MKYFTISELTRSDIASTKKIDNTPNKEIKQNLKRLIEELLDPIREEWTKYCEENKLGSPAIEVTSGYRCKQLNKLLGGASTSAHLIGYAVDCINVSGDITDFYEFILDYLKDKNYDECFIETSKTSKWIHIALFSIKGFQRKKNGKLFI